MMDGYSIFRMIVCKWRLSLSLQRFSLFLRLSHFHYYNNMVLEIELSSIVM